MKQSEIINVNDIICFHCQSKNTLKHGKSSNNTQRYKCKDCSKTFSFKLFNSGKNELSELTETYLNGSTIREIAYNIHCSVIRLNHKIRKFLTDCPKWEDYLDSNTNSKNLKVVYLTSKKFAVKNNQTKSNYMYLLIAEDVLSSVVIGFDIVADDNEISWSNLLNRTNKRAYEISQFLFNGNLSLPDEWIKI